ncbi:energy-coupling factor transporter transmembrane component T family protein [Candidatus Formimonas warabiya]|uniref:Energy-coupling factor transporter transmembrane protein EcfT n=1 Tax=Formimonas warabiya TaxID=1761012 RepID=A0A3G1KYF3_FORW1|nr:energy-coupling factor transporter transmembrane component T [Candidatus Formimonas warabiya]ATW27440.1 hypothetical protein DCMF_24190 [Candidatus Formimonas warabiya]
MLYQVPKEQKKLLPSFPSACNAPGIGAGSKILVLSLIIISLFLMHDWRQLFINLFVLTMLSCLCGVLRPMAGRVKHFIFLCLAIVAIHAFFNPHNDHFIYFIGLEGFHYGLKTALRLLGIVIAGNLLLLTTEVTVLVRWFGRINSDLGMILGLSLSIIPVMQRQMATTLEVQSARGLRRDRMRDRFFAFVAVIVPVIVKSIIRAHTMAQLLYLRGYDGRVRQERSSLIRQDWYLMGFGFFYFFMNLYFSIHL